MAEYTTEENQELIDQIKGPKFYRITINGYGGESEYIKLTEEQFNFWNDHIEEHGDGDAVNYCTNAEDGDFDFDHIEELPEEMQFLKVEGEDYSAPWYEAPTSISHQWGVDYGNAHISIDEVDGADYGSGYVNEVVENTDIGNWCEDNEIEVDMDVEDVEEPDYVLQFYSSEKGCFFEGTIETTGPFDPKKLKIYTSEYLNGDDTISSVTYDGDDVDNSGGDTTGKGYSVHVWKNV